MNEVQRLSQRSSAAAAPAAPHAHHTHPAHPGRGQFGACVFRLSRAPAQAPPRRAAGLRMRAPLNPPQGVGAGVDLDPADDEGRSVRPVETQARGNAQDRDPQHAPPQRPLRARVLPTPDRGGTPLHTRLQRAGWPGLADLGDPEDTQSAHHLALALQPAAVAHALPAGQAAICMAAVALFLQHDRGRQALSTLGRVKQLLLGTWAPAGLGSAGRPLGEREQNANVLRVAHLINAGRPRTPQQRGAACSRLALLGPA